jgi:uncharacterized protein HemX
MKIYHWMPSVLLVGLCVLALSPVLAQSTTHTPNGVLGTYVYPKNNQSAEQQSKDEAACYTSAEQRTGYYPYGQPPQPVAAATGSGGAVRGAARGAAAGAAIGAVAGDAGQGAAIGAVTGVFAGHRQQRAANAQAQKQAEAQAQAQHAQHMDAIRRAYGACLDAKGYSVK